MVGESSARRGGNEASAMSTVVPYLQWIGTLSLNHMSRRQLKPTGSFGVPAWRVIMTGQNKQDFPEALSIHGCHKDRLGKAGVSRAMLQRTCVEQEA